MPTVDFTACLANYWFVWTVNGLGTLFGLAINMAISYFFLKYFHSIQGTKPPTSKRPSSGFENIGKSSPPSVKSKA